jgi:predicted transposase YbfD/YdcC
MPDPRTGPAKLHKLIDILTIALLAVICGADDWVEVHDFGEAHQDWLKTFLELPNGIPSHDTFGRVFALLQPQAFEGRFLKWIQQLATPKRGEVIALDGKVLCGSRDRYDGQEAIVMISAYASESGLTLIQQAVPDDTNEIGAMPEVLKLLWLQDCVVTMDSAHCQTENARLIVEQGGDYVFVVKENQGTLHEKLQQTFEHSDYSIANPTTHETVEKGHGRIERRHYTLIQQPDYLDYFNPADKWGHMHSVVRVERERQLPDKTEHTVHYYISSLTTDVVDISRCIRSHWGIENRTHWLLDVVFREDHCRVRVGFGPENFAVLRHIALNLLKREQTLKRSIKRKRFLATMDRDYLLKVLQAGAP